MALSLIIDSKYVTIPIESENNNYSNFPAICEIIRYLNVTMNEDCIVMPNVVCGGGFVGATISRPINGKIPVKILNTRKEAVTL